MAHEKEKQLVGDQAVMFIEEGMRVGIGTGSTIQPFIHSLIQRVQNENLSIKCVCTSLQSKKLIEGRIPLLDESLTETLDISFDGADLFDPKSFTSIKGGGGALLREKLVALVTLYNIVLIDHSKLASPLQKTKVAIEIVPFGASSTIARLNKLGYSGSLRGGKSPFVTDNHNYLFDIEFNGAIYDPISEHDKLKKITGVVETGFFFNYAKKALIGHPDGTIQTLEN